MWVANPEAAKHREWQFVSGKIIAGKMEAMQNIHIPSDTPILLSERLFPKQSRGSP